MPTPYPPEFRRDVIAVARQGEQSKEQVARSFAKTPWPMPPMPPTTARCKSRTGSCESAPSSWSRRTRSCAERPPTSPARPSQNDVPAGRRPGRRQDPCRGDLPGARVLQASLLPVVRQSISQRDWDDAHLINAAIDIHHDDPEFGYRFITDELAGVGIT